jgi:hypothetical protein
VKNDHKPKRQGGARSDLEVEAANRARITAALREQRLKRDAEIAAAQPPVLPPKTRARQKVT